MSEVGKYGKEIGAPRARDLRKTDPVPERATPARKTTPRALKRFGYSVDYRSFFYRNKWETVTRWYKNETARDQAMAAEIRAKQEWTKNWPPRDGEGPRYQNFQKVQR